MLHTFAEHIWIADGTDVSTAGFVYPTRMVVVRLADGTLWLWSPVRMTDDLRAAVDALGQVAHLVAPNNLHHMFMAEWAAAYPAATVYAAEGVAEKQPDLRIDVTLGNSPVQVWGDDIEQVVIEGNAITQEAVFFHRPSATAIFTDFLQQFDAEQFSGWRKWVARFDLMIGDEPHVPRKFRLMTRDKAKARTAVAKILDWPTDRVICAHGAPVRTGGAALLKRAFDWLM